MPVLTSWGWLIPLLGIGAELALSALLIRTRQWHTWPALSLYVVVHTVTDLGLLALMLWDGATGRQGDFIPALYFCTFWLGAAVQALLELAILYEIARHIAPPAAHVLTWMVPALAVGCLSVSAVVMDYSLPFALLASRLVVTLDRLVSLAWLLALITIFAAAESVGVRSKRLEMAVSVGFTVLLIGETILSLALGIFPQRWGDISFLQGVIFVVCLGSWAVGFLRAGKVKNCSLTTLPHLDALASRPRDSYCAR